MQTYDFIVVGSGSAGSVVAERLSASGRYSVLVLEAGGSDLRFYVQMPLGYGKTFFDPAVNWNYSAEPDPGLAGNCRPLAARQAARRLELDQRHGLDQGPAARTTTPGRDAGNPGWGFDDLLPVLQGDRGQRGRRRRLARRAAGRCTSPTIATRVHPLTKRYLKAAASRPACRSTRISTAPRQEGVGIYQITTKGGRRMSAARAFLRPAMKRKNVRVEMNALATKILFEGNRAVGVEYEQNGKTIDRPRRPRGHPLRRLDQLAAAAAALRHRPGRRCSASSASRSSTPTRMSAPICRTMSASTTPSRPRCRRSTRSCGRGGASSLVGMQYILLRSGPLSLSMNHAGGFFRTDPAETRPNMQLYFQAFSTVIPKSGERPILTPDPWPGFSIGLSNCRPTSRGEIMIRSSQSARLSEDRRQRLFDRTTTSPRCSRR